MGDTNEDLLDDGDFLGEFDIDGDEEDALLADDNDTTVTLESRLSRGPEIKKVKCNPDDEEDIIELGVPEYDLSLAEEDRGGEVIASKEVLVEPAPDEGKNESDDEEDSRNRSRFKAERNIVTTRRGSNSIPETLDNIIVIKSAPAIARRGGARGRGGMLKQGKNPIVHLRVGPHPRPLMRQKFPPPDLQVPPPMGRRMIRPTIHVNPHFRPRLQKEWQDQPTLFLNQGHNPHFQYPPNVPAPFNNKPWAPPSNNAALHQRLGPPVPQWNSPPPDYGRPPDPNHMSYQNNFNDYQVPPSGPPNMCFPPNHPMESVGWNNPPCYPNEAQQPDHSGPFPPRFNHPPPHQIPPQFNRPPPPFRPHFQSGMGPPHNKIPRPPIPPNNHHLQMPPQSKSNTLTNPFVNQSFTSATPTIPKMTKKYTHHAAQVIRNLQPVNIVENTKIEEPPPEEEPEQEDEEMKAYRMKIEKQKKLREEILRLKEEKRAEKQRLGLNNGEESGKSDLVQKVAELQKKAMKELVVVGAKSKDQGPPNKKRPASDTEEENTKTPSDPAEVPEAGPSIESHTVEVNNLSASTTKKQLLEMGKKVGSVQSLELVNGQAKISFESTSEAAEFVTRYQRKMVDLSMISVTLVPDNG